MADRQARDILANALSCFMQKKIRSNVFDETVSYYTCDNTTADRGVVGISQELCNLYDDLTNRPIRVSDDIFETLRRVLLFLQTDLDYCHTDNQKELGEVWDEVKDYWPFASTDEWADHKPLTGSPSPEYNPTLIAHKPNSYFRILMGIPLLVFAFIGVLLAAVMILIRLRH
jgi:hypothetical protein